MVQAEVNPLELIFLCTFGVTLHYSITKGPDVLKAQLKNELVCSNLEQNQTKVQFVWSFQEFETACQSKHFGKVCSDW